MIYNTGGINQKCRVKSTTKNKLNKPSAQTVKINCIFANYKLKVVMKLATVISIFFISSP